VASTGPIARVEDARLERRVGPDNGDDGADDARVREVVFVGLLTERDVGEVLGQAAAHRRRASHSRMR